jgi:tetratricopeptide (TPR) repeat protein
VTEAAGSEQRAAGTGPRGLHKALRLVRHSKRWLWVLLAVAGLLAATIALLFPGSASAYYVQRAGRMLDADVSSDALYQTAEGALRQALAWNPANAQAYRLLGQLHVRREDWSGAADAWAHFVALRPTDPQGYWSLSTVCELLALSDLSRVSGEPCGTDETGRQQRLVELWKSAGQSSAGFVRAGDALQKEKAWSEALGFYYRALLLDTQSAMAWSGLGEVYQTLGKDDLALEAYAQVGAVSLDPEVMAAAHESRGAILAAAQRWSEASTELAQAVRLIPDRGAYHLSYGWYLYQSGADRTVVGSELTEAARLSPANPWPYVHLATLAFADGDYARALEEARAAVELDAGLFWGWLWQGKALASLGRLAEAEDSLRRAVDLAPDKAAAHAELGLFLKQDYRLDAAIEQYEEAVRLAPADVGYWFGLADAYRAKGQVDQAVTVYQQILELDPDNALARRALVELGP